MEESIINLIEIVGLITIIGSIFLGVLRNFDILIILTGAIIGLSLMVTGTFFEISNINIQQDQLNVRINETESMIQKMNCNQLKEWNLKEILTNDNETTHFGFKQYVLRCDQQF